MKAPQSAQSATSLPRAPKDDAGKRSRTYLIMMSVRFICFALLVLVTPYSWYTWLFAAMAIFLPYVAVVIANVSSEMIARPAASPDRALDTGEPTSSATRAASASPRVVRISESTQPAPSGANTTQRRDDV